jgi:hypothetical protein
MFLTRGMVIETIRLRAIEMHVEPKQLNKLLASAELLARRVEKHATASDSEWDHVGLVGGCTFHGRDNNDIFTLKGRPCGGLLIVCWTFSQVWGYDERGGRFPAHKFGPEIGDDPRLPVKVGTYADTRQRKRDNANKARKGWSPEQKEKRRKYMEDYRARKKAEAAGDNPGGPGDAGNTAVQ